MKAPWASTRLAPERDHREVMQRARAFRIFEIHVALSRNDRLATEARGMLATLQDNARELERHLELHRTSAGKAGPDPTAEQGHELKRKLIAARNILLDRIEAAHEAAATGVGFDPAKAGANIGRRDA